MMMDLLLGSDKSILVLGEPGSGKTTIIREATRCLAETKNVIVVDTSNEIAGDGMIPHECIGASHHPNPNPQVLCRLNPALPLTRACTPHDGAIAG